MTGVSLNNDEATAEIERLRGIIKDYAAICKASQREIRGLVRAVSSLRLTEAERDAISYYIDGVGGPATRVATLRGLLGRHFPVPENGVKQDTTPQTHSNQSEVSMRPECAVAPAWMAKPFWVDPPSGHRYGFPRLYDPAQDGDMTQWMVANGYPQHLADKGGPCTFTAAIDAQ